VRVSAVGLDLTSLEFRATDLSVTDLIGLGLIFTALAGIGLAVLETDEFSTTQFILTLTSVLASTLLASFSLFISFKVLTRNVGSAVELVLKILRFNLILRAGRAPAVDKVDFLASLRKPLRFTGRFSLVSATKRISELPEGTVKSGLTVSLSCVSIKRLFMFKNT
jgi:hypothetical protein